MKLHIKNVLPIIVTLLLLFLLTGCLSVKTYTVTFDSQGGSAVDSQTVNYGGLVTEPTDPTKEGSTFGGWYKEPECTNAWDFTTDTVISDVTLFAKWMNTVTDIITYKFEADKNGALSSDVIGIVESGDHTVALTVPYGTNVDGLVATFTLSDGASAKVGTTDQVSGTTANNFSSAVTYIITAQDTETTQNWTVTVTVAAAATYTVTYNGNGNTGGSVPTDGGNYEEGATVTVLANTGSLTRINDGGTSYRFTGWNTQADGNGTAQAVGSTFIMGADNVTLYAQWTPYALRDTGPAGGLIFYDKGSYSDGWRYLEAAPNDQSTSQAWSNITNVAVGGTYADIGTGQANTNAIIGQSGHIESAAQLCDDLTVGDYSDWFLPSRDELNLIYQNLKFAAGVGGFADDYYWSSSENNANNAWNQNFNNGNQNNNNKNNNKRVRAVRGFKQACILPG